MHGDDPWVGAVNPLEEMFCMVTRREFDQDGMQSAGSHTVTWDASWSDGRSVASGVYICRLSVTGPEGTSVETRKLVALK